MLGYGTTTGGSIPGTDIERSFVDDATLRTVADQLAVPYVARSDGAPLAAALPDGGVASKPTTTVATAGGQTETYWLPALVAAFLILIELYFVLRDFRRSRLVAVDMVP